MSVSLTKKQKTILTEIGLGDVVRMVTGTGVSRRRVLANGLTCQTRQCVHNDKNGKCKLPADRIVIDRNWECKQYARG